MGLGPAGLVSLSEARRKRDDAQRLLLESVDPIETRRKNRQAKGLEAVKATTFKEALLRHQHCHDSLPVRPKLWPNSLVSSASP